MLWLSWTASAAILLASPATAAPTALTVESGQLLRVDLGNGQVDVLASVGIPGLTTSGLAWPPGAATLFGIAREMGSSRRHFYRLDRETGVASFVADLGDLSVGGSTGSVLEVGPDGKLYTSDESMLLEVDHLTGASTPVLALPGALMALAATQTSLYAIREAAGACVLERLDLELGTVNAVDPDVPCVTEAAAESDSSLLLALSGSPLLAIWSVEVMRYHLGSGAVEPVSHWSFFYVDPPPPRLAYLLSLAEVRAFGGVAPEIPTVGRSGAFILALGLGGAALGLLRRRRRTDGRR